MLWFRGLWFRELWFRGVWFRGLGFSWTDEWSQVLAREVYLGTCRGCTGVIWGSGIISQSWFIT